MILLQQLHPFVALAPHSPCTARNAYTKKLDIFHAAAAFTSAFLAGAINSVAGGGTLLSFPTLVWLGLDSVTASATSTVAIWPGTVGSIWGYRRELREAEPRFRILLVPCLILFATLLFMAQEPIQRMLKTSHPEAHRSPKWLVGALLFQLAVGIY